jgi:hypothetical protein
LGSALSAGRSIAWNALAREPGSFLKARVLSSTSNCAIAALSYASEKNWQFAQACQYPALDQLHAGLRLGLVARTCRARRNHRHAVVAGELGVARIELGLVAVRVGDRALEVVRVMCPPPLCGRQKVELMISTGGSRARGNIIGYRAFNQSRSSLSSFQTALLRPPAEAAQAGSHARKAAALARSVNSAYRLVVSKLT